MRKNFEDLLEELRNKNIRLSHQRLKVLEYMYNNRTHPTVDEIYRNLRNEIPTLSKTTVYNTLDTLIEAELVRIINIEDNEARYDIDTSNHGHFKCESCGAIYDFKINLDFLDIKELKDFMISSKEINFKGICKNCIK